MQFRNFLLLAAASVAAAVPAFAAPIETVVVTAAPPDPVGSDAFSHVVVTPEQLRASRQLDAALKQVPGLSLFRRDSSLSANPTTQGVTLRSIAPSGAGRALVTLDGVPQNDPFGNWVIWSALPAEDLGQAQVVRGAGAGPYGAGALTGVIELDEATGDGFYAGDLSGGSSGQRRAAASGGFAVDRFDIFASASGEASNGWVPVSRDQRGAADDALTLDARNASIRVQTIAQGDTLFSARFGAYEEHRHSGLVDAESSADGVTASLTIAHPQVDFDLGWRVQGWVRDVGLTNTSVLINANRASTAITNNQYSVPATGWGGNAALRGKWLGVNWEVGADARFSEGESRELAGQGLATRRVSGGRSSVEGLYAEGALRQGFWLFTLGARVDGWETANGHLIESDAATGAVTKQVFYPSRSGTLPTARAGVRYDLSDDLYLRGAAYEGFRAPSLNELYRPFRVGVISTIANPALVPENLYGGELGIGGGQNRLSWSATAFWNQLHNAIANVTLPSPPNTQQRQNIDDIDAFGVEAEGRYALTDWMKLDAAFDLVDAHVASRVRAPQLDGLRPAQAPRWTVTAGFEVTPIDRLSASAHLRYESRRFADDLNTLPLSPATTVDARVAWAFTDELSVYVYGDNLFNAHVASTTQTQNLVEGGTGFVTSYSAPRIVGAGLSFAQ